MKRRIIKFFAVSSITLVLIVLLFFISTELTSKPAFCSTCHYMEPYVEGWKTSTHSDVTCTDCHFPPGLKNKLHGKFTAISMVANYMTGIYKRSKPWAEISDASCLRSGCHQERLLSGEVIFKEGILFDHAPHLNNLRRGKKLRCTSCHSQIVQGAHITVTETTCFLCHFKDQEDDSPINDCTWCHNAPVKGDGLGADYDHTFILEQNMDCKKCHGEMQVGDGAVPVERCSSCHAEQGIIDRYSDAQFVHKNHVTDHKVECDNCHLAIQHKSVSRSNDIVPECASCHSSSHSAQLLLFTGTGGRGIPNHPDPMFESGLNCQACHIFHEVDENGGEFGEVTKATSESCEICHGKGYNRILDQWQDSMEEKVYFLDSLYQASEIIINEFEDSTPASTLSSAAKLMKDAEFNFKLVKKGNIVHNVAYSDQLLEYAFNNIRQALGIVNSGIDLPDFSLYGTERVPSECSACHYGIEDISVDVFDLRFSHKRHILKNGQSCYQCHSNKKQHGELIITRAECLNCHHSSATKECGYCHDSQMGLYEGSLFDSENPLPDIMYEAEVTCRDCHENDDEEISRDTDEKCISCHDDSYVDLYKEWQSEVTDLLNEVEQLLAGISSNRSSSDSELLLGLQAEADMIRYDRSSGVHNHDLVIERLSNILTYLRAFTE